MRPLHFLAHAFLVAALTATVAEAQQDRRRMRFRGMDTNRDGVITRDEWRGNARSFDVHDQNNDGVLSGSEVRISNERAADERLNERGWDDLVDLFDSVDRNNDGVISRAEWYGDRSTFTRLDRDRNGVLRLSEFLGTAGNEETAGEDLDDRDDRNDREDRMTGTSGRPPVDRNAVTTQAYRAGFDRGVVEGRQAGREDRDGNRAWDLEGQRELEQADSGYQTSMGRLDHYQAGYRAGFRQGYRQGYGPR